MKKKLMLFLTFIIVNNLNAMQSFRRYSSLFLKNNIRLTPRLCKYLFNSRNNLQLNQLIARCDRSFSPKVEFDFRSNKEAYSFKMQGSAEQNNENLKNSKHKLALKKAISILEREHFNAFLTGIDCDEYEQREKFIKFLKSNKFTNEFNEQNDLEDNTKKSN